jgi:hypothetical protein
MAQCSTRSVAIVNEPQANEAVRKILSTANSDRRFTIPLVNELVTVYDLLDRGDRVRRVVMLMADHTASPSVLE